MKKINLRLPEIARYSPRAGGSGIRAVFIDKDGTLIEDVPYNIDPSLIVFQDGAADALRLLKKNNFLLIVVSNQPGIAKGFFSIRDLENVYTAMQQKLSHSNVQLDAFYYCPHFEEGAIQQFVVDCDCRKPKPGLLLTAAEDFDIDLQQSWMIGDILDDIEAGNAAGCKTILMDNGNETEWQINQERTPAFKVTTLAEAAQIILEASNPIQGKRNYERKKLKR